METATDEKLLDANVVFFGFRGSGKTSLIRRLTSQDDDVTVGTNDDVTDGTNTSATRLSITYTRNWLPVGAGMPSGVGISSGDIFVLLFSCDFPIYDIESLYRY